MELRHISSPGNEIFIFFRLIQVTLTPIQPSMTVRHQEKVFQIILSFLFLIYYNEYHSVYGGVKLNLLIVCFEMLAILQIVSLLFFMSLSIIVSCSALRNKVSLLILLCFYSSNSLVSNVWYVSIFFWYSRFLCFIVSSRHAQVSKLSSVLEMNFTFKQGAWPSCYRLTLSNSWLTVTCVCRWEAESRSLSV